jgi:serine/threonine protein kinase
MWVLEICQGVAELHEEGIELHDLKPSNVLLDGFGGVVLTDFGLARIKETATCTRASTSTGLLRGTVPYM